MSKSVGKHAFGYCDRTGFRYPIDELVDQYVNLRPTGLLVGKDMVDIDHEQLQLSKVDASDRQSLNNPRPDKEVIVSRALSAWNPVGGGVTVCGSNTVGLEMELVAGKVSIS